MNLWRRFKLWDVECQHREHIQYLTRMAALEGKTLDEYRSKFLQEMPRIVNLLTEKLITVDEARIRIKQLKEASNGTKSE